MKSPARVTNSTGKNMYRNCNPAAKSANEVVATANNVVPRSRPSRIAPITTATGRINGNKPYLPRNPLYSAIGYFDPDNRQPIRFKKEDCSLFMHLDEGSDGFGTVPQIAVYGTMTHQNGKNVLWYPERKFFLLVKNID